MSKRIIGIDLAVTAQHQAAILDLAGNEFIKKGVSFRALPDELDKLLASARQGASSETEVVVVLEATGMAWHPVGLYLERAGAQVYRVNGQKTKELRRVQHRHARRDGIDCQVLARLYTACPEQLDRLWLPSGEQLALQRACREYGRWRNQAVAIGNRLTAYDHWAWQGLRGLVPAVALPWVRQNWYDPWQVVTTGEATLRKAWQSTAAAKDDDGAWIADWLARAALLQRLFGNRQSVDFPALQATVRRNLEQYSHAHQQQEQLQSSLIQPFFQRLYPDCPLTTIYGIGSDSAAVYMAFIHSIERFPSAAAFRQWAGIVPASNQSGEAHSKGLPLTQAGPDPIKATLYLNADVARQWDLHLAKLYYTQMVNYGKHHTQAVCACASHLATRIYTVLKQNRPYELRDLEGKPITAARSKQLIREQFKVPDDVRKRTNVRKRADR